MSRWCNAALWTSAGRVTFRAEGTDSGMIDGLAGTVDGAAVDVPSLRLRDILAAERIDLLKLDIEGAEDAVLADCEPVLDRVGAIVMDLHEFDPSVRQAAARPRTPHPRRVRLRRRRVRAAAVAPAGQLVRHAVSRQSAGLVDDRPRVAPKS